MYSTYVYYECGGNYNDAVKKVGERLTTANGLTLNKASQIEFMKQKNQPDYSAFPDSIIKNSVITPSQPVFKLVENHPDIQTDVDDDKPLAFDFPTFDFKHFYGIAGELADIATLESEADPMAVYISFLVVASAMLGRYKYLQIGESQHYARLFIALVGASSRARKGTSFKPVLRVARRAEEIYNENENTPETAEELQIASGGLSSAEGLIFQVRDEAEDTKGKDEAPLWSGVVDKRLLITEEEFANALQMCKREGNTLSAILRRAWDGGDLAPMTKNNRLRETNPHINILAHITQFELKCLMSQSDIHNGLSNRFLWACVRRTKKLAFPQPMPDEPVNAIAEALAEAIANSMSFGEVKLSQEARDYWEVKYHEVSKDGHGIVGAITSRAEAQVMRLSLLFCLLGTEDIEVKQIEAAINLIEFCNKSVEFIFSTPAESEAGTDADKLLRALAIRPLSQTDVSAVFSGHKKRSELMALLNELQSMNRIKSEPVQGSKKVIWMMTGKELKK